MCQAALPIARMWRNFMTIGTVSTSGSRGWRSYKNLDQKRNLSRIFDSATVPRGKHFRFQADFKVWLPYKENTTHIIYRRNWNLSILLSFTIHRNETYFTETTEHILALKKMLWKYNDISLLMRHTIFSHTFLSRICPTFSGKTNTIKCVSWKNSRSYIMISLNRIHCRDLLEKKRKSLMGLLYK